MARHMLAQVIQRTDEEDARSTRLPRLKLMRLLPVMISLMTRTNAGTLHRNHSPLEIGKQASTRPE